MCSRITPARPMVFKAKASDKAKVEAKVIRGQGQGQ